MGQAIRFTISSIAVYALTVGVIGYALSPITPFLHVHDRTSVSRQAISQQTLPIQPRSDFSYLSGIPVRIVIPDYAIDLPIDAGYYNAADGSWTLSPEHAQYAMMTSPANNLAGNTLVYGHGTDAVFGKLGARTPVPGAIAEIYTGDTHAFRYAFVDARDLTPSDTSVLEEGGTPATLTVQTCTGLFSEWRTMFRFQFKEVIQ
jgi:Sortase domain